MNETDEFSLNRIKLNEFNTVLTASKTAIDFISSTTDRTYADARTSDHNIPKVALAPPIFPQRTIFPPSSTKLTTLNNRIQRICTTSVSHNITAPNGNGIRGGAKIGSKNISPTVSLLHEAQNNKSSKQIMVRSPLSTSASKTRKSKSSKETEVTLKPETSPVVIRSYSRDKLIATLLDWYKSHPHPDNPKSTMIRKLLKKDLVSKVFDIQELMRAKQVVNDLPIVSPSSDPADSTNTHPSTLEVEDIQRLIGERYYELNGKHILLTSLHGKHKQELLYILNNMEPEESDVSSDDDYDDDDHYEEDNSDDEASMDVDDDHDEPDGVSITDLSLSDSVKKCINFDSESETEEAADED